MSDIEKLFGSIILARIIVIVVIIAVIVTIFLIYSEIKKQTSINEQILNELYEIKDAVKPKEKHLNAYTKEWF